MSSLNTTIWMNVTTSANWKRPPVGIVRVERSLCTELEKLYVNRFKQCIWDGSRFVEFIPISEDFESHLKNEQSSVKVDSQNQTLPRIYPKLSKRKALEALAQGFLSLVPSILEPAVNRFLYFMRPIIIRLLASEGCRKALGLRRSSPQMSSRIERCTAERLSEDLGVLFSPGDVLISVGLDWDYSYYKRFYELRKEYGIKVVTCCYDLIPVLYPQYCVNDVANIFANYFLELADASDVILCISRQSEKDLNEMLYQMGGASPATMVFPLGDKVPASNLDEISPAVELICSESFILYVSTIERRKNHEVLYRAYHLLCSQGKRASLPKLVFVGMPGWGVSELLKDIELDPLTQGLIIRLNHVNDAELAALYKAAKFCVFPSLYEGWGLPVGEALSMGKALICSNKGSLPEVGGGLVQYLEPWSPDAWAEAIHRLSTDESWLRSWEERVVQNYSTRAWADAANVVQTCVDSIRNN
jgi:glycosyltransferase involved in cell wall biosynthesis